MRTINLCLEQNNKKNNDKKNIKVFKQKLSFLQLLKSQNIVAKACSRKRKSLHTRLSSGLLSLRCLVLFRLNVPVNNFSVMSGRSYNFLGITSTFRGVNVSCSRTQHGGGRSRTPTSRSGVRGSTTRPLRSLSLRCAI